MANGLAYSVVESPQVQHDQQNAAENDAQIHPQFLILEHAAHLTQQKQIVAAEIDAEQRHEHGGHILQIGRVRGDGIVFDAETAGACRAESGADRVEQGHVAKQQEHCIQHRQTDVDHVKDGCGFTHFGYQFTHAGTGAFRPQQVHGETLALGAGESQQEDQYAHAAQPVAETAPIHQTPGEGFHIGQDRRTGGGKSGHDLKERIHIGGDFPGNVEGQRAHQTHCHPADGHAHQTLFGIESVGRVAAQQEQHGGNHRCQQHRPSEALHRVCFTAENADDQGGDHEDSLDGQDLGDKPPHHFIVHSILTYAKMSLS